MDFFAAIEALNKPVEEKKGLLHNGQPLVTSHRNGTSLPPSTINKTAVNGKHHLFVYGTLKRNNFRNSTLKGCSFVGEGYLDNSFKLMQNTVTIHNLTFPILLHKEPEDPKDRRVLGEIYSVDDAVIRILDVIENEPRMYRREILPVRRDTGNGIIELHRCIAYVGNPLYWRSEELYPVELSDIGLPVYIFNPTSRKNEDE